MKDIDLLDYGFTNLDILAYEHTVFLKIKKTLEDIKKNKKIKSENLRTIYPVKNYLNAKAINYG